MTTFNQGVFDEYVSRGFCVGRGDPASQVCVEVALALANGEGPTDQPSCAHAATRQFAIYINDLVWPSPQIRAEALRPYALAQLGTSSWSDEQARQFARRLAYLTITQIIGELAGGEKCRDAETLAEARDAASDYNDAACAAAYAADYAETAAAATYAAEAAAAAAETADYAYTAAEAAACASYAAEAAEAPDPTRWLRRSVALAIEAIDFASAGRTQP